jgi:hypothetical protein
LIEGVFTGITLAHVCILGFRIAFDKINPESAIKAQKGLGGVLALKGLRRAAQMHFAP